MDKRFLRLLQVYLAIIDISALAVVFFTLRYLFNLYGLIGNEIEYTYLAYALAVGWLSVIIVLKIYNEMDILSFESFTKRTAHSYVYFILFVILCVFFLKWHAISRLFIILVLSGNAAALLVNRFLYIAIYQYFKKRNFLVSKVLVIGYNDLSKKLVNYLEEETITKDIIGYCEESENIEELSNYPILSNIENAFDVCKSRGVSEIYSTIAPEHNRSLYDLIQKAEANCIRFKIVPDLGLFIKKHMHLDYLNEIPVIMLRKEPLEDIGNRMKKRIFDILVSSLVIIFILSWLIPILSLLIWLESKGPIFFVQPRSGKGNKSFPCIKFRSMYVNDKSHSKQATRNDERITNVGRFLRRTNLDEFPQFINVLKGQMSIVGPRPHMLKHTDEYSKLIGSYMVRQLLKPGITGWAQVNGLRGETQTVYHMQRRVESDLWYMENWSLVLDLKIMYMTIFNVMKGEKNAF